MKPKTRLSLYYLVTYLFLTGVALLFAPQLSLKLLLSTPSESDPGAPLRWPDVLINKPPYMFLISCN